MVVFLCPFCQVSSHQGDHCHSHGGPRLSVQGGVHHPLHQHQPQGLHLIYPLSLIPEKAWVNKLLPQHQIPKLTCPDFLWSESVLSLLAAISSLGVDDLMGLLAEIPGDLAL